MTRDITPLVEAWLQEPAPLSDQGIAKVGHLVHRTPQRRRWWPFSRQAAAAPPSAVPDSEYQLPPIPATNGQSATVTGRTQSMFSPVKAITAGALVFAIGGVLLIAQPFDQQRGTVPGAATDAEFVAPVEVTGTMVDRCSQTREEGDPTILPGSNEQYTCTATSSFSDERLSGLTARFNENVWFEGNGLETAERLSAICADDPECEVPNLSTVHSAMTIRNDVGVWRERPAVWFNLPGDCCTGPDGRVIVMDGEAGHEGLVAILQVTVTPEEMDTTYYGFILDARQLNPAPDNASTK